VHDPRDRGPVTGSRYTTFKQTHTQKFTACAGITEMHKQNSEALELWLGLGLTGNFKVTS